MTIELEELPTPESMTAGPSSIVTIQADIELNSFLPLIQLLSGYQKDASSTHYIRGPISSIDSQRLLEHAEAVGKFHIVPPHPSHGTISTSTYLSLIRVCPSGQAFFPNLKHLSIADAPHAITILPFFHSTPSIKSLHIQASPNSSEELPCFLQQMIDEGVELTTLCLGPGKVSLDVYLFLPKLVHLRHIELSECLSRLNMDNLKALGSLPCLEVLWLHATELDYPSPPTNGSGASSLGGAGGKKKKKGGQSKARENGEDGMPTPPNDGSDSQTTIVAPIALYFAGLKNVDVHGDLELIKDLANLISSRSITDISVVLKSHDHMREGYYHGLARCALCIPTSDPLANKPWGERSNRQIHFECVKREFLDLLQHLLARQSTVRSVSLGIGGLYSKHLDLTESEAVNFLQLPSLRDLSIDDWKTDNAEWIQNIVKHQLDHSQLTTLHLPTQTTNSIAPWIRLTDLVWISKLFPCLRSFRCLIDGIDQTALRQIETMISTSRADVHGLTTLSVGTPRRGNFVDHDGLLTVAEFLYFIFSNVEIIPHPGLNDGAWSFVGRMITAFRRNRNHDSARRGDGAD